MEPLRPGPRPGALSDLEAKLLAANVAGRLFDRPSEPVQLGRYRILERLGQGGMGVVFRAHDPQLRRDVALKLLHAPRAAPEREQHARLRREALALGRLSHPHVVQVFEVGEADGSVYIVMELVRGPTLRAWLTAAPRTPTDVLTMLLQVGRGLAAAHAAGVVHRDLKPENVLVGADGRARIVDFGLARAAPTAEPGPASLAAPLTRTGAMLGTPAYMAPEQVADPARADARADQFSFCVLAYESLHGERPYADLAAAAAGTVRPAPAGTHTPQNLRSALLRGLQPDPAARWPSMDALLAALDRPQPSPRPAPPRLLLAALALTTTAAIAIPLVQSHRHAQQEATRLVALREHLGTLRESPAAAEHLLVGLVASGDPLAPAAWAAWPEIDTAAPTTAWATAYALAPAHDARHHALRGLARALAAEAAAHDPPLRDRAAAARALLAAEAPDLLAAPDTNLPTAEPAPAPADHVRRLAAVDAPPAVLALARAGLLDLAAAALRTLAAAAPPPTRRAWRLAAAPLLADSPDLQADLDDAAEDPRLRDAVHAQWVALHLERGALESAAHALDQRLADAALVGPERAAAGALQARLARTLAARAELVPRPVDLSAATWTDLDPAALRSDPADRTLVVHTHDPGLLAAWPLALAGDRLRVDLELAPTHHGTGALRLRVTAGPDHAELALVPDGHGLRLRCDGGGAPAEPLRVQAPADPGLWGRPLVPGAHRLQLDLDVAAAALTCRSAHDRVTIRTASTGAWSPGPIRLELHHDADRTGAHATVTRLAATGAATLPTPPDELARAAVRLVGGDVASAAAALADLDGPRARLWQALALVRLARLADALTQLQRARADDPDTDRALARWLRADPSLAPGLRQTLGDGAYRELFVRAWAADLAAPTRELVARVLAEPNVEPRCDDLACAALLGARGRALADLGDRVAARRALEGALTVASSAPAGRELAGALLVELTTLKNDAGETD